MSESNPKNLSLKEATIAVEQNPLQVGGWQRMLDLIRSQNDVLSVKSLEVIVYGLETLTNHNFNETPSLSLSTVLTRLARSCNNPKFFKEAGKAYLHELHMARQALQHLERAAALGCKDNDLRPLTEAAASMVRNEKSRGDQKQQKPHKGRYGSKLVSEMIRRSGKLCIMKHSTINSIPSIPSVPIQMEQLRAPADPNACLDQAWDAISTENWGTAKRLLANLSVKSVGADALWEGWTEFGEGCYRVGQYDDAEVAYQAACNIYPDLLVSQFNLGVGLQVNQKYEAALEAYMKADNLSPSHPKVWCNMGCTFFLMDDYARSEAALRTTVLIKPDYARAWDNLAAALGAQGKLAEAATACSRALAIRPDYPEASFKLGVIYFSQQQFSNALPHLAVAASLPALSVYTNAYLSMTLAGLGNVVGAEHALKMASSAPGSESYADILSMGWCAIGRTRMERLEFTKSKTAFENACRLNPGDSQNWLDLGLAHQFVQDTVQANECYKRALELDAAIA